VSYTKYHAADPAFCFQVSSLIYKSRSVPTYFPGVICGRRYSVKR